MKAVFVVSRLLVKGSGITHAQLSSAQAILPVLASFLVPGALLGYYRWERFLASGVQ